MTQLFSNNAYGSLGSTLSNSAISLTLGAGQGARFPSPTGGDHFALTLIGVDANGSENIWEIVKVTGRSGDVLTVVRGQEGTIAASWSAGTRIEARVTSGAMDGMLQKTGGNLSGNLAFDGVLRRILGDFSNVTGSNRLGFQTSTANSGTTVNALPNGSGNFANFAVFDSSDADNAGYAYFGINATDVRINTSKTGTGISKPLNIYIDGAKKAEFTSTGINNTVIGGTTPAAGSFTTLSATGNITASGGDFIGAGGAAYAQLRAAAADNTTMIVRGATGGQTIEATVAGVTRGTFSSAGLSVTGALSASGGADIGSTGGVSPFRALKTGVAQFLLGNGGTSNSYLDSDNIYLRSGDGSTTKATLDTSGNLGLGVTPSAWNASFKALQVNGFGLMAGPTGNTYQLTNAYFDGAYKYYTTGAATRTEMVAGAFSWSTAPSGTAGNPISFTQEMALDASGNLLVGQASQSNTTLGASFSGAGSAFGQGYLSLCVASSSSAQTCLNLYSTGAAAYRFYVDMGGTVHATSTSIAAISDASLKENIRDLETGLPEVMALKPRRFDWKSGDAQNVAGFIAQELEEVLPELVYDYKYNETETKKSIKMGDILPTLVKAMQEQQALIESLQTRLTALEGI